MGVLAKMFNAVPAEDRKGISLDFRTPQWKVSHARNLPAFLRALPDLIPEDSILYVEGVRPATEVLEFLRSHAVTERVHVAVGTIWPRPTVFHLPATTENLRGLADLAEHRAIPEVAVHLHLYHAGRVFLQWYDAFSDPFYVSKEISEDRVSKFSGELGIDYETNKEGEIGSP